VPDPWFSVRGAGPVWLDEAAAVFLRTEPPVDEVFTAATLIMDLIDPARTVLVNAPQALRECSEHLFPLRFPDLVPPTTVTADARTVRDFLAEHGTAVIKPVDGFSGRGVLRLDRHDPNLTSLIEISTALGSRPVLVQRYLREVAAGNKRVFVVDGAPVAAVYRFPAGRHVDAHLVEAGRLHLAGQRPLPDQLVEPRLLRLELTTKRLRRPGEAGGANRLVRLLRPSRASSVRLGPARNEIGTVALGDQLTSLGHGRGGHRDRVGAHVGDEADLSLGQADTFVQALRHAHRAPRAEAELA
jgi:hypothetical protein